MAAKQFREHINIFKVLKPDTSPGQTKQMIRMNATISRFQCSVGMVSILGLMDPNRVLEVRASPTARIKKAKVQISEIILRQRTADNKPVFLSLKNKYTSVGYEACYIKLYTKKGMDFGDCPARYLVHYFSEAKDDIYKALSPSAVKAARGAVWDEEEKRLVTLQVKEENEENNQVARQKWLMEDASPAPKQLPEQDSGSMVGEGIQQEEQKGGQKQVTGIHFDFYSGLSVETTHTTASPPIQREGPTTTLLFNPQGQVELRRVDNSYSATKC